MKEDQNIKKIRKFFPSREFVSDKTQCVPSVLMILYCDPYIACVILQGLTFSVFYESMELRDKWMTKGRCAFFQWCTMENIFKSFSTAKSKDIFS